MNTTPEKEISKGNPPVDDNRIRPGFVALLAAALVGVFAIIFIPLSMHKPVDSVKEAPVDADKPTPSPQSFPSVGNMEMPSETVADRTPQPREKPIEIAAVRPAAPPPGPLEKKWGIRVSGIWMASENGAVQMTYEVTDNNLAKLLSGNGAENFLVDLSSGTQIPLCPSQLKDWPFSPHSRARSMALQMLEAGTFPPPPNRLVAGKTYTVLIPNPNGLMKPGSRVAPLVGGVQGDSITIE